MTIIVADALKSLKAFTIDGEKPDRHTIIDWHLVGEFKYSDLMKYLQTLKTTKVKSIEIKRFDARKVQFSWKTGLSKGSYILFSNTGMGAPLWLFN
jgi:hypothetical protein